MVIFWTVIMVTIVLTLLSIEIKLKKIINQNNEIVDLLKRSINK